VYDLLSPDTRALELKMDEAGLVGAAGAGWAQVDDAPHVASLLARASAVRSTGRTACNERSSRSHMVLSLKLTGKDAEGEAREGVLHLVDLAGSERLSRSGAEGEALKETQAINKSLSALGDVIGAIAAKAPHVPFRNSKLTHLLSPALGGDAKTLMLVAVAPTRECAPESLCSLRFAAKVNSCELATVQRKGEIGGPLALARPGVKK
jgi:kinesin family protein C1